ncbi:MAG: ABC transporter permease [Firmicutes bacterium]|nr:ABC transporter permease [Bacillota bacterium]MDD4337484.1 ABC transporter permease [Bacillota bacterium]MDD4792123.1 ABC transporter permease [Bacillota bacterium]
MAGAFNLSLLVAAIRLTTPILLAALGGLFTQQANVLNIALEGMMLSGAFTAVAVSFFTHSWVMAILASVLVGLIMAWILGAFVVKFKALNVIAGMAVNLFASGFTAFLLRTIWTNKSEMTQGLVGIPDVVIPGLCNVPVLGELLSGYSFLVYISIVLVFVAQFVLYKTKLGLRIRAVGETPQAAASLGVDPDRIRLISILISGALCGLAGAHLSLGALCMFTENMTAGRGFMAMAVIFFGDADPYKVAIGAFLFGLAEAISMRLQSVGLPSHFIIMIPYVFTVVSLIVVSINKMKAQTRKSSES